MNVLKSAIVGLVLISANTPVHADVIGDWNNTAMDVMKAVNVAGNPWTRSMALVNVSMSDAVNSVQNRYSRYIPELPIDPNASAEAAAAAAAREILMRQYPGQKERIDAAFAETTKTIPDNPARAAGIDLGKKVADAVFTERQSDATNTPDTYRPLTTPGVWVPTSLFGGILPLWTISNWSPSPAAANADSTLPRRRLRPVLSNASPPIRAPARTPAHVTALESASCCSIEMS